MLQKVTEKQFKNFSLRLSAGDQFTAALAKFDYC